MRRKGILRAISLVLMIVLAVVTTSCGGGDDAKTIKVGVVQAQTGAYAGFGIGDTYGIETAVADINALGGVDVDGEKMLIELIVMDNQSDTNKAGTLAENLITQKNVNFIVTGDEPPVMHPGISNICERYKVPYITSCGPLEPWGALRASTDTQWQYTWSTGLFALGTPAVGDFREGKQGYAVNDTWIEMLEQFGDQTNKKVAVFASDDSDGIGWYNSLPEIIKSVGYEPIGIDKKLGFLPMETTDFSSVINEWKAQGAEIIWGNAPAPFASALWKQCATLGFEPKMAAFGRAALFYQDISAWGGDLPYGVGSEIWWTPTITEYEGIGDRTPISLAEKWTEDTNQPLNPSIGSGYRSIQVLIDAIERAGSLDAEKINAVLAETDLMTIGHKVMFDENHFNRTPISFGQWFKTDDAAGWELKVVYSKHDFIPVQADPIFPINK